MKEASEPLLKGETAVSNTVSLSERKPAIGRAPATNGHIVEAGLDAKARADCARWVETCQELAEFRVAYDADPGILWTYFDPRSRPSITPGLAVEGRRIQAAVKRQFESLPAGGVPPIRYMVCGSRTPGIFSMGGDLHLLPRLIRANDRDGLIEYATACIDLVYENAVNLDLPVVTISLVQGDALGGGFEAAISSNVVIAEKSAKFGLPEVYFGLFPGMGAYSLISRRIGAAQAERMIFGGQVYSAQQLYDIGLVDHLAEDGEGEAVVRDFVARSEPHHAAQCGVYRARRRVLPLAYEELLDVAIIWVDTAGSLTEPDLRKMERLAIAQDRRLSRRR